jgi:AmmeMemoRadiSam system protein B
VSRLGGITLNKKLVKLVSFSLIGLIFFVCKKEDSKMSQLPTNAQIRALKDTVGFSFNKEQIQAVVQLSEKLEQQALEKNREQFKNVKWIAGICPHDDHLLAGRVYGHLFQNMNAKRYVIFGVAHKAASWGVQDSLVFDSFDYWRAPYGPVKVSELRQEIIELLPKADFVVNNDWQSEEHSVEGIVPFIQYYRRDAEIVSILVPYMNWERIEKLSQDLSQALSTIIKKHNWKLGDDIAFLCSNDGDHYGDQDWGGNNLAPFGADEAGYLKATQQDGSLIKINLTGELTAEKLQDFCKRVWGENDLKEYKIRWCGRFAIPSGLNTVRILMEKLNHPPLSGYFLRYDNSYNLGKLPLDIGIGTTAPNNIHHWVGYSAIGYF